LKSNLKSDEYDHDDDINNYCCDLLQRTFELLSFCTTGGASYRDDDDETES